MPRRQPRKPPGQRSVAGDDAHEPRRRNGCYEPRSAAEDVDPQRLPLESHSVRVDVLFATWRLTIARHRRRKGHDHGSDKAVPIDRAGWASVVKTAKHAVAVCQRLCDHLSTAGRRQARRHAAAENTGLPQPGKDY